MLACFKMAHNIADELRLVLKPDIYIGGVDRAAEIPTSHKRLLCLCFCASVVWYSYINVQCLKYNMFYDCIL